ncbi:unnamed protein product [Amoebophrya sp. A25]|nr:unnamed protein product [Amoebophrya sp. A25]|eukprot:GSA25T00001505001.1
MASLLDLKEALMETLEAKGVLGEMRAQVQKEIFCSLDEKTASRPDIPTPNLIINELIREYLEYNQNFHTLSVFLAESGHPETRVFDRRFIADELKVGDVTNNADARGGSNQSRLPLLYALTQKKTSSSADSPEKTKGGGAPSSRPSRVQEESSGIGARRRRSGQLDDIAATTKLDTPKLFFPRETDKLDTKISPARLIAENRDVIMKEPMLFATKR